MARFVISNILFIRRNIVSIGSNISSISINCSFIVSYFLLVICNGISILPILAVLSAILALFSYLIINVFQLVFCGCTTRYRLCLTWNPCSVSQTCYLREFQLSCRFNLWRCNRLSSCYRIKVTSFLVEMGEVLTILSNGNVITIDKLNGVTTFNLFSHLIISDYISKLLRSLTCCLPSEGQITQISISCIVQLYL